MINIELTKACLIIIDQAIRDETLKEWVGDNRIGLEDGYAEYAMTISSGNDQPDTFDTWCLMRYIQKIENIKVCPSCNLNPNGTQSEEQQRWELNFVREEGVCSACLLEQNETKEE